MHPAMKELRQRTELARIWKEGSPSVPAPRGDNSPPRQETPLSEGSEAYLLSSLNAERPRFRREPSIERVGNQQAVPERLPS